MKYIFAEGLVKGRLKGLEMWFRGTEAQAREAGHRAFRERYAAEANAILVEPAPEHTSALQ